VHSAIRKDVSLAMGLFRKGTKKYLQIASRPPPCITSDMHSGSDFKKSGQNKKKSKF
jgi:hypothetical protein